MAGGERVEIYDWDREGSERLKATQFRLLDTTLRDGVQTTGIKQPTWDDKRAIIDFDARLGIEAIDIHMPTDPETRYFQEGVACAKYMAANYPNIERVVLARTIPTDVEATIQFAKDAGVPISVILFRGSSDPRLLAENWNEDEIVSGMEKFARKLTTNGLKVICATEDTTRSRKGLFLKNIFEAGKTGGASEFCIADTVGFADPDGVKEQIKWMLTEVVGGSGLPLQYHGHDDTRNSVSNSIAAIKEGVETIHITWLGVGERAGNTPIEGILSDLDRRGIDKYYMGEVVQAATRVSKAFDIPIPRNHPLVGEIVFRTSSGIHAAGIDNARRRGFEDIAGIIYSAVDPRKVGRELEVVIGPLGGSHSVHWVLDEMGLEYSEERSKALLAHARAKNGELTAEEIKGVIIELEGFHK